MPRGGHNRAPAATKRRYFELIRQGARGSEASTQVGVSLSCGSLWFIDAGSVTFIDSPISSRYLSQDDRIEIADGLAAGESVKVIAARIGKSYQTVYREIGRNRKPNGRYQPWYAHGQAHVRRQRPKTPRVVADPALRAVVAGKLAEHWSPAQVSRWLRRRWPNRPSWQLCTETIYEAAYRGLISPISDDMLRTGRTYRHARGRGRTRDGALKQSTAMKSIHDRPTVVETRSQVGHWEGDLIIGGGQRSAIATLVERKARLTLLVPVRGGHSAQVVGDALIAAFAQLPAGLRRTLTWDQGNEMFHHARIEQATGLAIYFADPHSPWQRGTNENTNGLLRQYFPKGTDLNQVTDERLAEVADELNHRPRLVLGDRTQPNSCDDGSSHRFATTDRNRQVYPVVFIDAIVVKVRDGQVTNKPFYVAIGVTVHGERDILGIWAGDGGEGAKFWLNVLTEIKNRGVADVLMLVCDGLKGLPDAVNTVWENTVVQTCVIHLLRNTFRYAARQDWDRIAKDLRPIYTAVNESMARERFGEFAATWRSKYPAAVALWERAWSEFVPFLDYDVEIRKIIATTNSIESLNARYRRAVRARGHFPTDQAALKCLYLVTRSLDPTGRGKARWVIRWKVALNAFAITFEGRISPSNN